MQVTANTKDAYTLMHRGALALQKASQNGMRIDVDYCKRKIEDLTTIIDKHHNRFWKTKTGKLWDKLYGTKRNINSDLQIKKILFTTMKLKSVKLTNKKNKSVDNEVLNILVSDVPEIKHILKVRKYMKARDTYLKGLLREQVDGVLRPFFPLHLVKTFRSSSNSINFHNQPKRDEEIKKIVRSAIYARPAHQLAAADFAGIEVRMACIHTEDERLIYDVIHGDMHRDIAIEIYMLEGLDKHDSGEANLRQGGKNGFIFPEFYGDYYGNCAPNLLQWAKLSTLKDGTPALVHLQNKGLVRLDKHGAIKNSDKFIAHVKNVEDAFWNVRYRTYTKWKLRQLKIYEKQGYIESLTGFRFSGMITKNELCNYPLQSTAFHCLLWSFIELTDRIEEWDSMLIGQIHDEIVADTKPEEKEEFFTVTQQITCKELPEAWPWITVPLEIDAEICPVDRPWYEMEHYEIN